MGICMTKKELATVAGYTYPRLYDIDRDLPEDKKLFVAGEGGKYDLAIFVQRWVAYNIANEAKGEQLDLEKVKAKHEAIKAEKTQLEVDRMRGELVDVQDVRKLWGDIAGTVTQSLLNLPSKVAPMLRMMDNVELIASIIDEDVRKILNEIADTPLPDYAAEPTESEDDDGEV